MLNNNNQPGIVQIGIVQWLVRRFESWTEFSNRAEAQVRALADADFVVFPEYFTLPLLLQAPPDLSERDALLWLGRRSREIRDFFSRLAQHYGTNIVVGSTPETEGEALYNTAHFCHRDGRIDAYRKLHLTPYETEHWHMQAGDRLGLVHSDRGYVGLCICYDVEFPELCRLYADAGARLLLVPYSTDSEYGHSRVRYCAQARAIENECYVGLAGCVGNLPEVPHLEYQHAQSVVLTPSDYGFAFRGIAAEAPVNAEAAFRVEVDLHRLSRLHTHGTVQTMRNRRTDLYHLSWQYGLVTEQG